MKLIITTTALLLISYLSSAQWAKNNYDDEHLGWLKMYKPNEPTKPSSYDHRSFSAKQLAVANLMRSWVQASYSPKGAIGDVLKVTNEKIGLYNEHTKAMPNEYGVYTKTYFELKKNAQGKYIPETNSHWWWNIKANGNIGDYVRVITSPEQFGDQHRSTPERTSPPLPAARTSPSPIAMRSAAVATAHSAVAPRSATANTGPRSPK